MEPMTLVLAALLLLLWICSRLRRSVHYTPPCPVVPLPLVGHLFHLTRNPRAKFREWRKKCGDLFSLYLGGNLVVVLNGYEVIKEVLVKNGDVCSDRPSFFTDMATGLPERGVIFSSGPLWKEQRAVTLSILKTFGMGKNMLSQKIQEEVTSYLNHLAGSGGQPMDIRLATTMAASNIIWSILIGQRFEYDDQNFQMMLHQFGTVISSQQTVGILNFISWLKYIPGDIFRVKKMQSNILEILKILRKLIAEKRRDIDGSGDIHNFIEAYIKEEQKRVHSGMKTTLDEDNLTKLMFDLFGTGTETASSTIYWCVLYAIRFPETQEKIFQEIHTAIGTHRAPTIQDKPQLIYLNAFILESQRLASIVPHSVTHLCSADVSIRGYTLPKGAYLVPNLDSVLLCPETWGHDAFEFRPERFLDANNKLRVPEQFIPFGLGQRVCLGEAMARTELFLFLAAMFQRFQFLPPSPDSVPTLDYDFSIVVSPKPYKVRAVERI